MTRVRAISVLLPLALGCSTSTPPAVKEPAAATAQPAAQDPPSAAADDACARVAVRFDVIVAPLAMVAAPPEHRPAILAHVAAMRVILLDECRRQPWAAVHTTCFEQSADADAWQACETRLPAGLRADLQARLDAIPRDDPPDERARRQVRTIAFEYFPQWALQPKRRGCPASLAELAEFVEPPTSQPWLDPWGTTLSAGCEGGMLVVTSAGPDRMSGTPDDISSRR